MSEDTKPSGSESNSGNRMTDADFAAARERYELGTATLIDLSDEYGISRQALSERFKRNGVVKGSRAHEVAAAAAKGAKSAAEAAGAAADRFQDKRAEWIEEARIQGVQALKQARLIAQKTVVEEMKKPGGSMEAIDGDLKALGRYNKILLDNLEGTLRILRSDEHIDEEDLPILSVEDLTNEEILDHHKMTGALPEDATVEEMLAEDIEIDGVV
ncbi:hypothetical protein PXK56_18070 [Phaeobacter gallaeciensis]|uniref:hypothetical protein n=1 Tax=Phaeobacter gallaeciensis TaxID=60890 RepID=UPI002380AB73|nr:hypothetical protein [Phaeobacter gallaeciensis]MDE4297097.1 hypothetical protein [Phaeobacter gallaeciensis]